MRYMITFTVNNNCSSLFLIGIGQFDSIHEFCELVQPIDHNDVITMWSGDERGCARLHMWPLSSAEVDQINDSTHLVTPHRANQCLLQLKHVMRGVARLFFVAFLFSLLLLLYHQQSRPMMECGAGVSREVSQPFVLPDNLTLASLNITGRAEVDILFFNRVPKVITWNLNLVCCLKMGWI